MQDALTEPVADANTLWSTTRWRWVTARPAAELEPCELKKRHQAVALDDTEDELCAPANAEGNSAKPGGGRRDQRGT